MSVVLEFISQHLEGHHPLPLLDCALCRLEGERDAALRELDAARNACDDACDAAVTAAVAAIEREPARWVESFTGKRIGRVVEPTRCRWWSRAYNSQCDKASGHDGVCSTHGDVFGVGHDPLAQPAPQTGTGKEHARMDGKWCAYLAEGHCNKCGWVDQPAPPPQAEVLPMPMPYDDRLAASQAREQALRRALAEVARQTSPDMAMIACADMARRALVRPADDTALREFGVRVARAVLAPQKYPTAPVGHEDIVDAVLKGAT